MSWLRATFCCCRDMSAHFRQVVHPLRRRCASLALMFVTALCMSGTARATDIRLEFHGIVTSVHASLGAGRVAVNDAIHVVCTFDAAVSDGNTDPNRGDYELTTFTYSLGSYTGGLPTNPFAPAEVQIFDDVSTPTRDAYRVAVNNPSGPDIAGQSPLSFVMDLNDDTASLFSDDALRLPPDISLFSSPGVAVRFEDTEGTVHFILGTITSITRPPSNIVYDNTTTSLGSVFPTVEAGDQIVLEGPERVVTEFSFGYRGNFLFEGDERAVIRFYANNGIGGVPRSLLFESAPIVIVPTAASDITLSGLLVPVPDSFTWSFEAMGLSQANGESAGPLTYDPPTVGFGDDFLWSKLPAGWTMVSSVIPNWKARVIAVPEPSAGAVGLVAALSLSVVVRSARARRRDHCRM